MCVSVCLFTGRESRRQNLIYVETFKNSDSHLIETCEALNTTDEKAQNLLVRWPKTLLKLVYYIKEVVLFCDEMWGNPINIQISAIQNTELMF